MRWHGAEFPVVDTHADSLGAILDGARSLSVTDDPPSGQADIPRLLTAGVTLQFFSCWVESAYKPERALARLLEYVDAFHMRVATDPRVVPVTGLESFAALESGPPRVGAVLSVEGAEALGTDPAILRVLWLLGVRLLSLTWNQRNALADGAGEDPGGGGLSRAGRTMIAEMNRLHMVVDVSHLAAQGFWDVLGASDEAPIASHSNCRALAPHARNLSDAQMRALARAGGVQGITFVPAFLGGRADRERVVDHCLHHLAVVGNDRHLGIGSDFDGVPTPVAGLEDVTRWPELLDDLAGRGLADETVQRIAGGNFLTLLRDRWRQAATP
ncbi:MAG: membrane dipeptidase [Thermaerobacter sp.]|nr:membrane dipeptidase [Thermaerobacter sp.]